jgi:pimeloyl-ACP methyl ester carboxylesterase
MSVETDFVGKTSADSAGNLAPDSQPALPSEGCPSPLGWVEVLESFRNQSTAWSIEVDGSVLHGRTLGQGRPLYFLNGISGNCELFCLLAWLLREDFRCVLFDYRSGETTSPRRSERRGRLVATQIVNDFMTVAGAQSDSTINVFAANFGSLVALSALLDHPDRVARAILLGGFARRRLSRFERLLCGLGRLVPGAMSRVPWYSTLQCASHQRGFPPFDASRWDFFAQNTGRTPIRELADRAALMAKVDLRGRLSQVEQPVFLLRTEHEGAISSAGQDELEHELPRASSERIPLAGQLAYLTHPHRVAKAVRSFLGDPSSEQRPGCEAVTLDNSCCADHKDGSP